MREIKFRVWDKELKEMNYLSLEDLCEDDYWYDGETSVWSVLNDCNGKNERFEIGQYTGLKDKNGVEIYEGDRVKAKFYGKEVNGEIGFCNGCFLLWNSCVSDNQLFIFTDIEVIGNIYENKLKEEGK